MPSNVRVAVRVRPLVSNEIENSHKVNLMNVDPDSNKISIYQTDNNTKKSFTFDKILDQRHSQQDVFENLQIPGLISKVVDGFHATIFAYGQTGSGKTFTMEGYEYQQKEKINDNDQRVGKVLIGENSNNGISIRAIKEAFRQISDAKKEKNISISCSFLQIYNEKVFDLLNTSKIKKEQNIGKQQDGLKIRWNKNDQFQVENLFVFKCNDAEHCMQYYNKGIKNKIVASHNLNHASSRSHCIFTLIFEITDNSQVDNQVVSKLQLVDLAGSERTSQTGTTGLAQKESIDINQSLFTLRKVITGLADASRSKNKNSLSHIPYRDSKLTCLLKQSLGGNSYALMIACLAPSNQFIDENISTLNYATKASFIQNIPSKNEDPKMKLVQELKEKVQRLEKELASANNHIQFLSQITGQSTNQQFQPNSFEESLNDQNIKTQKDQKNSIFDDNQKKSKVITQKIPESHMPATQQSQAIMQGFNRLDHETLSKKLIESVEMIKELHQSNKILRDNVQNLYLQKDQKESYNFVLQNENRDLRDRIEILENVIGAQTYDVNTEAWRDLLYPLVSDDSTSQSEGNFEKIGKHAQQKINLGSMQKNSAVTLMAQNLVEFRKGNSEMVSRIQKAEQEKEEIQMQNMQLIQQNKILQQQLLKVQEKQMKQNQLVELYSFQGNQNVNQINGLMSKQSYNKGISQNKKPLTSEKEALELLNQMMENRIAKK